jgi:hypothetical protein
MVYQWKGAGNNFHKLDAQAVGEYLEEVRGSHSGRLTADDVVVAARDESSPIHAAFNWDDESAAEAHRRQVARNLMGSIRCVVTVRSQAGVESERTTRALISVRDAEGPHYAPISVVLASDDYRQQLIVQARKEMLSFKRKYAELEELLGVFAAIDEALPALSTEVAA